MTIEYLDDDNITKDSNKNIWKSSGQIIDEHTYILDTLCPIFIINSDVNLVNEYNNYDKVKILLNYEWYKGKQKYIQSIYILWQF